MAPQLQLVFPTLFLLFAFACAQPLSNHPPLGALVPRLVAGEYDLQPQDNQYQLSLRDSTGGSRDELVELRTNALGQESLYVTGNIRQYFGDNDSILTVIYEAGVNGYVAKYMYGRTGMTTLPPAYASASFLKTAAG